MISLDAIRIDDVPVSLRSLALAGQRKADISLAASQLAMLGHEAKTRQPRVYTGRVFARRAWRGMQVVLPNGRVGALYRALRGLAVVAWREDFALRPDQYVAIDVGDLHRFKFPAAAILGSGKRGVRERPSKRKADAARINGSAPPRPGSRPRGRPRNHYAAGIVSPVLG